MVIGFSDPGITLPSCGCVLHASLDVTYFAPQGSSYPQSVPEVSYPLTASGLTVTLQVVFLPITAQSVPFPTFTFGPPWANGCHEEPSLSPVLSRGYRIVLP